MARLAVMTAFRARLAANWDTSKALIIEANEEGQIPLQPVPWIMLQFPTALEEPKSVGSPGSNVYREDGAARIVIAVPRGRSTVIAETLADELATMFRAVPPSAMDGVETFGVNGPHEADINDDGRNYAVSISIAYTHDIFA